MQSRAAKLGILAAILAPAVVVVAVLVYSFDGAGSLASSPLGWAVAAALPAHLLTLVALWRHASRRTDLTTEQRREARGWLFSYSGISGMLRYWHQYIWHKRKRGEP